MENGKALAKTDDFFPFVLMDQLDDSLIIQELEGRLPEVLTYHFTDKDKKEIWGISKAGVDEAKAMMAKNSGEVVRELEVNFIDGEHEAMFNVKSARYVVSKDGREVMLDWAFGFKRQPKKTPYGNDNPFWYEQGAIKACRNASMRLIPKAIQQAVIEYAKKENKVKEVGPSDVPKQQHSKADDISFIKAMQSAKENLGDKEYYAILTTRFGYDHANLVKNPEEQKTMLKVMRDRFRELNPPSSQESE